MLILQDKDRVVEFSKISKLTTTSSTSFTPTQIPRKDQFHSVAPKECEKDATGVLSTERFLVGSKDKDKDDPKYLPSKPLSADSHSNLPSITNAPDLTASISMTVRTEYPISHIYHTQVEKSWKGHETATFKLLPDLFDHDKHLSTSRLTDESPSAASSSRSITTSSDTTRGKPPSYDPERGQMRSKSESHIESTNTEKVFTSSSFEYKNHKETRFLSAGELSTAKSKESEVPSASKSGQGGGQDILGIPISDSHTYPRNRGVYSMPYSIKDKDAPTTKLLLISDKTTMTNSSFSLDSNSSPTTLTRHTSIAVISSQLIGNPLFGENHDLVSSTKSPPAKSAPQKNQSFLEKVSSELHASTTIPVWTPALLGNAYGGGFIMTPSVFVTIDLGPTPLPGIPAGYGFSISHLPPSPTYISNVSDLGDKFPSFESKIDPSTTLGRSKKYLGISGNLVFSNSSFLHLSGLPLMKNGTKNSLAFPMSSFLIFQSHAVRPMISYTVWLLSLFCSIFLLLR